MISKILTIFLAIFFLAACDKDDEYDKAKAISAFAVIDPIRIDKNLQNTAVKLPKQQQNDLWNGSTNDQNQRIENFSKTFLSKKSGELKFKKTSQIWSGYKSGFDDRFVFSPIIKNNKIFLLDTSGNLEAYDLTTKKEIFESRLFPKTFLKNYQTPKISLNGDKIFAIAGTNRIVAANESDGQVIWSKDISSIPVSTPISDGNLVYVSTNDNKLYALNVSNGELEWVQSGITRATAIFGAANPVIYKDLVIISYSSGEIYGVKKKTGEAIWSQDLNVSKATNSDFYLNDIDATPLVKDDVIYSIGNGGLMMAIKVKDGNYLWKKEIAGITDFWAAGEFLFVINNDNKLLAISKKTGGVKWISQLPNFEKEKKPETKIIYSGVILAGDKLLVTSNDGALLAVSPLDGKIEKTFNVRKKIYHSPIVVNDKIYLHTLGRFTVDLVEIM